MKDPFGFQNIDAAAILLQNGYIPCKEGLEFHNIQYEEYMAHTPVTRWGHLVLDACILEHKVFCVQETIGGWRQNPIYTGSLEGAREFLSHCDGNYALVPEMYLEVDYL